MRFTTTARCVFSFWAVTTVAGSFSVGVHLLFADELASPATGEQLEYFERFVRPVLVEHCFDCHSTDARELRAGLYVDSLQGMLTGGESGPTIVVGDPDQSLLMEAVRYESFEMPPDQKLRASEISALERWIAMGAPWPEAQAIPMAHVAASKIDWSAARQGHWAWQAVHRPPVPNVGVATANSIDNFVIDRRRSQEVLPVDAADASQLVRRIYLDLLGVVPTPTQVKRFVVACAQDRQLAVTQLVEDLLESPLYGQRWARHWLDVARYSDGGGGFVDKDALEDAWRYRDWVVNALNADMPYDRFLTLQLAGDLVGDSTDAIATGLFALGPTYRSDGGDPQSVAQAKGETLDDRVDTLTRGILGITAACARCHDHKFDPIPQMDYYSLAGIFNNCDVQRLPLDDEATVAAFETHQQQINELTADIKALKKTTNNEKRELTEEEQQQLNAWQTRLDALKQNAPPALHTAHTLRDRGDGDMHVAIRGDLLKQGSLAPRRMLRIVSKDARPLSDGSGRRQLAEAVVDPENPLTARVFVNRLWQHHFGRGLVDTPSNFGSLGAPPTHPELLDWLAAEFVASGWSIKALHRLMLTSNTYQLSSQYMEASFEADGDNRWLWRFSPRRMDVEAWRDSMLLLTGELDVSLGGPPVADIDRSFRRTLYAKVSRNGDQFPSDAFLRRFDFPIMRATVAKRPTSIVPQQFLFLLNSDFMIERARRLAAQITAFQDSTRDRVEYAYQLLFNRQPRPREFALAVDFLDSEPYTSGEIHNAKILSGWERYAQILLSSNEFMFVR